MVFVAMASASCEKKKEEQSATDSGSATAAQVASDDPVRSKLRIVKEEGPAPTPDTPIATAGEHRVTVADFERASKVSLLFAPGEQTALAPERLAVPHVHLTMTRALLAQKLLEAEAAERGVEVTEEEMEKWLREHKLLSRYGKLWDDPERLAAKLAPLELTVDDLRYVARVELLKTKLAEPLLEDVPDEEIWRAYELERTTRTAAIATMSNVPTSEEIDDWVRDHPDEIDEYFQKNPNRFRIPRRVKLNIVKPVPGTEVDVELLQKAKAELERGVQPVTIAKQLGMQHQLEAQLVRGENPKAFAMRPAEVGWTADGPRGAYAWKVVGFESSRMPEMSRSLRREIAAEMMRTQAVVPSARARLEKIAEMMKEAELKPGDDDAMDRLEKSVEAREDVQFTVVTFPNNPRGSIPELGLAEEILEATFADETEVGDIIGPALTRERAYVLRVLEATEASRQAFEKNLEANRKAYLEALRPRVVQMWAEKKTQELEATVDVKPLRIKYGVLQKGS